MDARKILLRIKAALNPALQTPCQTSAGLPDIVI
jgi:hypothetical protein